MHEGDLQEYQKSLRFSAFTKEKVVYVSLSVTQPAKRGFNDQARFAAVMEQPLWYYKPRR